MRKKPTISLLLFTAAVLAAVALCIMNQQTIKIQYPWHAAMMQANALIIAGVVLGSFATAALISALAVAPADEAKRLSNWQMQDTKLVAQIKSDREKQLEAKIATLETALKNSLKRG